MSTLLSKIVADFTTQLATAISTGGTTATLESITDDDGVTLPNGQYLLTIDGNNSQKEYWLCTLTGTSLTAIQNVSRQGARTAGCIRDHRVGASVSITDFAHILYINDLLTGTTNLNASTPLGYDGTASILTANQLATKAYVDGVAISGAPDASTTVKGISKLSSAPVSPTDPIAVGDNDTRVPTQGENDALQGTVGTPSNTNRYVTDDDTTSTPTADAVVRALGTGKIADGWISNDVKQKVIGTFTAGEAITAGNAVIMGTGVNYLAGYWNATSSGNSDTLTATEWRAQRFTTTPSAKSIKEIRWNINDVIYTFTFSSAVTVSPSTQYFAVVRYSSPNVIVSIRASSGGGSPVPTGADIESKTVSVNTGSGNFAYYIFANSDVFGTVEDGGASSTDGGTVWTNQNRNYGRVSGGFPFAIYELNSTAGSIYKSNASVTNEFSNNFIGFAEDNISASASGVVVVGGIDNNQSGLTVGSTYYLTNTNGAIGTTAGTNSRKVGLSLSATEILIKQDNP